jgi:DNA ligase (NAD+)
MKVENDTEIGIFEARDLLHQLDLPRPRFGRLTVNNRVTDAQVQDNLRGFIDEQSDLDYICDGIVLYNNNYCNENEYHPEGAIAFKVNKEGVLTTITGIDWSVTKFGDVVPVAMIEPVRIDGTTVSRALVSNYRMVLNKRYGIGAKVKIIKAGDIIPKIIETVIPSDRYDFPDRCPCCNTMLEIVGVHLKCCNKECDDQNYLRMDEWIRRAKLEGASSTSLKKWGIHRFEDILSWSPSVNSKTQMKFYNQLQEKVFNKTRQEMIYDFPCNGIGPNSLKRLLAMYDIDTLKTKIQGHEIFLELPSRIGQPTIDKMRGDFLHNFHLVTLFTMDIRFNPSIDKFEELTDDSLEGKSFCFTGSLSDKRPVFEKMVTDRGGEIKSVSKKLDYLVAGEKAGSKLNKAKELGIKILSEDDFKEMLVFNNR